MPAVLEAWGCDAQLWSKIRAKQVLIDLANAGDETAARERIERLRNSPSITGADDIALPAQLEAPVQRLQRVGPGRLGRKEG